MMDCLVIGDSIAVEISPLVPCAVHARENIPSATIVGYVEDARVLIVSAGTNDPNNSRLIENLTAIRAKASNKVIWILPINETARLAVLRAARPGDIIIDFAPAGDNTHPRSYKDVASVIRPYLLLP